MTEQSFLIEQGGELDCELFAPKNLNSLLTRWLKQADSITDDKQKEAFVYGKAYKTLVDKLSLRNSSWRVGGIAGSRDAAKQYQWFLGHYNRWAVLTGGLLEPIYDRPYVGGAVMTDMVLREC